MSIKLILGCMFASKTSTLMADIERHRLARRKCVIIKHTIDTRYYSADNSESGSPLGIRNHNLVEYSKVDVVNASTLGEVDISDYDVIGVNEAQFFEDIELVDTWANHGKIIICEGLSGDYRRNNFGAIHKLIPRCEHVELRKAVCGCGEDAVFTHKKTTGLAGSVVIEVGGDGIYEPLCRKCYNSST